MCEDCGPNGVEVVGEERKAFLWVVLTNLSGSLDIVRPKSYPLRSVSTSFLSLMCI